MECFFKTDLCWSVFLIVSFLQRSQIFRSQTVVGDEFFCHCAAALRYVILETASQTPSEDFFKTSHPFCPLCQTFRLFVSEALSHLV